MPKCCSACARGIRIAIDDFGTGYSSLVYLRRFIAHRLKIDKSFVLGMCTNVYDEGIVRAVIEMAHCLELDVVAEGVENAEVQTRLCQLGCGYGQGFHWSPALALEDFIAWMRQSRPSDAAQPRQHRRATPLMTEDSTPQRVEGALP